MKAVGPSSEGLVKRFTEQILSLYHVTVSASELRLKHFSETAITELVQSGFLTLQSATSYWFSFPNGAILMRHWLAGREEIINMIKRSKYKSVMIFAILNTQSSQTLLCFELMLLLLDADLS